MIHQYLQMQLGEIFPSNLPIHFHPPYFKLLHGLTLIHNHGPVVGPYLHVVVVVTIYPLAHR
jgi:hypothetical protein